MIEAVVGAAVQAIVFSVLLGAVLFALVFGLVRFVPLRAAARHAAWTIALVTTAVMPLAGFGASVARTVFAPAKTAAFSTTHFPTSPARRYSSTQTAGAHAAIAKADTSTVAATPRFSLPMPAWRVRLTRAGALALTAIWLAGVMIGLAGLVRSLFRVHGLKKRSSPLDGALADDLPWLTESHVRDREIYLRLSYETETPVAIGLGRPVILIPTELATHKGLVAIDQLIRHEHAHLRRYDDWTNLLQRVIERVFWVNPVVWLVGARIALEREIASDDAVVDETGHAAEYAKSLWQLAREMRMPEHAVVAPGALLTRKQISIRIESLLESRATVSRLSPLTSLGIGAFALACIAVAGASAPAFELPQASVTATVPPPATAAPRSTTAAHPARPAIISHRSHDAVHPATAKLATPQPRLAALPALQPTPAPPVPPKTQRVVIADIPATVSRTVAQSMREREDELQTDPPGARSHSAVAELLADCVGCDLHGRDLRGVDLRHLKITGADLSGTDLRNAKLDDVVFTGVDLSRAKLDGASLVNAHFTGVDISGVSLRGANITGLSMTGVSLARMDLRGLDVRALLSACTGCDLSGADLSNLDLHGIRFVGADLSNAKLDGTNLRDARFEGADLKHASLRGTDLRNASFSGVSLTDVNLREANTTGAHFTGIDLRGVTF